MVDPLTGDAARAEAEALLLLRRTRGLGEVGLKRVLEVFGSGGCALAASDDAFVDALAGHDSVQLSAMTGDDPRWRLRALARGRSSAADRRAVGEALEAADRSGVRLLPRGAAGYPERLLELEFPPPVLFLRGRSELLEPEPPSVAIVGARRATTYGRRTAARLGSALARAGAVVVSGLALGVDGEAHRGALEAGGDTVAVLGCGTDVAHPPSNAALHRSIGERGLLVSEFEPGTPPLPHHFPQRNRIMAALARVVVVVEAAERSGALLTVEAAIDLDRPIFAVPGPIDAPTAAGSNALLLTPDVKIALGPEEILPVLGLGSSRPSVRAPRADVDGTALWNALDDTPLGLDELAARSGLPSGRALAALSVLELDGWAVQSGGGRFARRAF